MSPRRRYRRSRALSSRTIYSRTGSKSQAKQIAALRNRVNYVSRSLRKELRIFDDSNISQSFTNSSLSSTYHTWYMGHSFMTGVWTNLKNFSLRGVIEYGNNIAAFPGTSDTQSGSVRIIIYQTLQSKNTNTPVSDLIDIANTGAGYELNTMRPFQPGVTAFAKIVYNRVYNVSVQRPQVMVNISLKKLLNMHIEPPDDYPRGMICVGIVTSGLHFVMSDYIEQITVNLHPRIVYTED